MPINKACAGRHDLALINKACANQQKLALIRIMEGADRKGVDEGQNNEIKQLNNPNKRKAGINHAEYGSTAN